MNRICLKCIRDALVLSDEMLEMVHDSEINCSDDACLLLLGMIRDSAYKIRQTAEIESQSILEGVFRMD